MLAVMKRKAAPLDDIAGGETDAETDAEPAAASAARAPPPSMLAGSDLGPVGTRMATNLAEAFSPSDLQLVDESSQHAGHAGAKGLNGESHFALQITSESFAGVRSLKRHQMVYAAIGDDMPLIHALSIKARAPGEE